MAQDINTQAAEAVANALIHGASSPQATAAVDNMLTDHGPQATADALNAVTDRAQD